MLRLPSDLSLRPITDDDREFLLRVYAGTRAEELAPVPWTDEQKAEFLSFQFDAQHAYYQQNFPAAAFDVLLHFGQPVGRLYVDRRATETRLIDIALLPERRGAGVGGRLLKALLEEAATAGKRLTIHVEHNNRAMGLYLRLGFRKLDEQGVYHLMEWRPDR
jgi:ribosomal protein S18 acetylase RimI-like enzyme